MPIYEFACAECGVHFDRLQKLADPDPDTCVECGAHSVTRCVTAPSFRLAGSGWYETDFKQDKNKQRNLAGDGKGGGDHGDGKESASKAATATDKPAADAGATTKRETKPKNAAPTKSTAAN